jgi:hypothetical protein
MDMEDAHLESIKSMLIQVINKQNDMDTTLREMDRTLSALNQTVIGNPTYGQKGLVEEIKEIKIYVDNDKLVKSKILGGLAIIGVVWTFAWQYFMTILTKK